MKEIMEGSSHTLFVARDGGDGLGELAARDIDVLIADLNMPKMDGLTMIEFFHKLEIKGISKIMLTTDITPDLRARGEKIGIDAWMPKPLKKDVILRILDEIERKILKK